MSLINQMLKDLEQRRAPFQSSENQVLSGLQATHSHGGQRFIKLYAVLLTGVVIALAYYIYQGQHHLTTTSSRVVDITSPSVAETQSNRIAENTSSLRSEVPSSRGAEVPSSRGLTTGTIQQVSLGSVVKTRDKAVDNNTLMSKVQRQPTACEQANSRYQQALAQLKKGRQQQAEQTLNSILENVPLHKQARETLVGLLLDGGKIQRASKVLAPGIQQSPQYSPFAKLQARILISKQKYQAALTTLRRSIPDIESDIEYYSMIASVYQHVNQPNKAASIYQRLLQEQPDNAVWWMGMAIALESAGKYDVALQAFQRAASGDLEDNLQAFVAQRIHQLRA